MDKPASLKHISTGRCSLINWLDKKYPEFREYLSTKYPGIDVREQLYLYYNNMDSVPLCPMCGKIVKFHGNSYGYSKYCCPSCAQLDKDTQQKIKSTCIERYGSNFTNIKYEKSKRTKLKKYGDENYNNSIKIKQTCIERYGDDNVMKIKTFQEKSKQTCIERYGVEYNTQRKEYKNGVKNRNLSRMKTKDPDIIDYNNNILTCKCPDPTCDKCASKQYNTSYYSYYERKYIYNICPCIIKVPPYTCTTYKNTSIENDIRDLLNLYNIKYIQNTKQIIPPFELDFYIPEYNIAIECNGGYWHSSKFKDNKYHYNKYIKCAMQNIQLLTIWEDQINSNINVVKSVILSKLGIYNDIIYARKCTIMEISQEDARNFLNDNHLQGNVNSSVRLGLYYDNKLVSLMTFGKKRTALGNKETSGWELYRFCNKLNTKVIGGASKLLNHFIKEHDADSIESFSSNDISNGGLYNTLGFRCVGETISYWYIKDKKRYHRYKFRKSELVKNGADKSKTEFQIMEEMGYYRIYDTGQKKWIYNK